MKRGQLYYSAQEVSKIVGLERYVLRCWEDEFPELRVEKNRAGHKCYTHANIKMILLIKALLRDERLTIREAQKQLATRFKPVEHPQQELSL